MILDCRFCRDVVRAKIPEGEKRLGGDLPTCPLITGQSLEPGDGPHE